MADAQTVRQLRRRLCGTQAGPNHWSLLYLNCPPSVPECEDAQIIRAQIYEKLSMKAR